jgi:N-acetylglucosamine-6-phosphate deacetylase
MAGAITNARILTPDESFEPGTLIWDDDGRITSAAPASLEPPLGEARTDSRGLTLVPGYIDIHVHGGGGFSLATDDPKEVQSYARWVVSHGVTGFLPTVFGSGLEEALVLVSAAGYVSDCRPDGGAEVLGINLEGPFINPKRRGALPDTWVRPPSADELAALSTSSDGSIKVMTMAPEVPGAEALLKRALEDWIVVAVGHSDATYEEARRAFDLGASHLTHAFNGMRPFHHRDPGPVVAALDAPHVTLEVIADGIHLHPATVRVMVRAAGTGRVALISDGVRPAGLDDGVLQLGDQHAGLSPGRVQLADGTLAGGAETMDQIVRNVVSWGVAGLADAARMASTVPARILGLSEQKGRLAAGYDADIIALDRDHNVAMTWVGGRLVYKRP